MKKTKITIIILIIGILAISGCTQNQTPQETQKNTKYPIKIQDKLQKNITINEKPEKIVSLSPSNSRTLIALDLEDKIAGVTTYAPAELSNKTKIGGFKSVNVEKVIEVGPDVVFAVPGVQKEKIKKLEQANVKVVTLSARNIEGIYENLEIIGKITDNQDKAKTAITEMKDKIGSIQEKLSNTKKKKAFFILWYPTMTVGSNTFIDDILQKSGLKNIAGDTEKEFPIYSEEKLIQKDPEVIIYSAHSNTTIQKIKNREKWENIEAVQQENIYKIQDKLINQPSPDAVKAIEKISKKVYPNLFED